MKLVNEQAIYDHWSPIIKSKTDITSDDKVNWLSKYCHYHTLNENVYNNGYSVLTSLVGMGNTSFPANPNGSGYNMSNQVVGNGAGSGDKFPSLLPLAIQVARRTIAFDTVNVIPMSGPTGVLPYLDYVYTDGNLSSGDKAMMVELNIQKTGSIPFANGDTVYVQSGTAVASAFQLKYIGVSRISGFSIFQVLDNNNTSTSIAAAINATTTYNFYTTEAGSTPVAISDTDGTAYSGNYPRVLASLVRALENHIQGPTGAGALDTDNWQGNFLESAGAVGPMDRATGESTYYRTMGIQTYTKSVEAKTYQIAANVTVEQIQDLNKQYGIDLLAMVEDGLINDVSQSINKMIIGKSFELGVLNAVQFSKSELGQVSGYTGLNIDLTTTSSSATAAAKASNGTTYTMGYQGLTVVATNNAENYMTLGRRVFSRILAAGNIIANRGGRGPGNFVVTNSSIATTLQDLSQFQAAPFTNTINQNNGSLYPIGTLSGMTVYVDPNIRWNDNRVLVGRKGSDADPGLKFMPYLMAERIQTVSEGTASPKIFIKSRFALVEAGQLPQTSYFTFYIKTPSTGILG